MTGPRSFSLDDLALPVMAAPMFLVSGIDLVFAQCRSGVIGAFPSLNARPVALLDQWLSRLTAELTSGDAPFAVNLIANRSNSRLDEDLALCVKHRVPIVITSMGARKDINDAIHGYGGFVFHDVTTASFARKAIEKGADGLIAVAAGAGGHGGTWSPFALVQEIRAWFKGPLVLSGSIATGRAIAAAQMMGADLAYIGSAFIATHEANADAAYKTMVCDATAGSIVYTDAFSGTPANYLRASVIASGFDPDALPSHATGMEFDTAKGETRAWRDIWGCGQGIGAIDEVVPVAKLIERLDREYRAALGNCGAIRMAAAPATFTYSRSRNDHDDFGNSDRRGQYWGDID